MTTINSTPVATPPQAPPRRETGPAGIEDPAFRTLFTEANDLLATTRSGREVAEYIRTGDVKIKVYEDAEYSRKYPGTGGVFQPAFKTLSVPERSLEPTAYGATLVAHEGQHALDSGSRTDYLGRAFGTLGRTAVHGATALTHGENPMTAMIDDVSAFIVEPEVAAYRRQAQVARELGLNQGGWAHGQNRDGTVRSDDEIRDSVVHDDLYRWSPNRRLLTGAFLATSGTLLGANALSLGISAIAPKSGFAKTGWMYATGALLSGAAILQDQVQSRALEAQRD